MILYLIIYTLFVLLYLTGTIPHVKRYERLIIFLSMFILWFVVSFSENVGPDYDSYAFMYDRLNESFFKQEFLFKISAYLFRANDLPFSWFYFTITSVYLIFIYHIFLKYRNMVCLNFLIFIIMPYGLIEGGFNYLRQNIAVALFYFSLHLIIERKLFKYVLINTVGALFHKSAILLFPLYIILQKNWSTKKCMILFILTFVFSVSMIIPAVKVAVLNVLGMLPFYGSTYVNFKNGAFVNALSGKGIASYIYQVIPLLVLVYYKDRVIVTKIENMMFNITFLSLLALTLALDVRIMLRLEYYFVLAKVFSLPLLLRLCTTKLSRTVWLLIFILYFSLYLIALYFTGLEKNLIPYRSVFGIEVN